MLPIIKDDNVTKSIDISGEIFIIRPWKTKDERAFMIKQASLSKKEQESNSVQQRLIIEEFVRPCVLEGNINKLSYNQLQLLMIELRCLSLGEVIDDLNYKCSNDECGRNNIIKLDLKEENVIKYTPVNDELQVINDSLKIKFRPISHVEVSLDADEIDFVYNSIDVIVYDGNAYDNFTRQEFIDFFESLDSSSSKKIIYLLEDCVDKIKIEKEYRCVHCGHVDKIDFSDMPNFFNP